MESLIHHFKIVTEGYRVPEGGLRAGRVAARRARLLRRLRRRPEPWRVKFRAPSFVALEATATCMTDALSPT
jgi:NADH-quinone oxidoreductase subunit D